MKPWSRSPSILAFAGGVTALLAGACDDVPTSRMPGDDVSARGAIVSEPRTAVANGPAAAPGMLVAYVSYRAGTWPTGETVRIENRASGFVISGRIAGGGLDPVPVPAVAGDLLRISIFEGGTEIAFEEVRVPIERPPIVVRGEPPAGKVKIPINAFAAVTFSEPMTLASLSTSSVYVEHAGGSVPGRIETFDDGIRVWFVPDNPLMPGTEYSIVVERGARDLNGTPLEATYRSSFQTVATTGAAFGGPGRMIIEPPTRFPLVSLGGAGVIEAVEGPWSRTPPGVGATPRDFTIDGGTAVWWEGGVFLEAAPDRSTTLYVAEIGADVAIEVATFDIQLFGEIAWSPDGQWLAYPRGLPFARADLYLIRPDGTDGRQVTTDARDETHPSWSPTSEEIVFLRHSLRSSLVVIDPGTGEERVILTPSGPLEHFVDLHPDWSPDGGRIAVTVDDELWIIDPQGQVLAPRVVSGVGVPRWSPDGEWIAVSCPDEDELGICVVRPDGSEFRLVARGTLIAWVR